MPSCFRLGPAVWVTAAFIGPGTVVTASLAGATFGYALLWALLFAMSATLILQEMSLRLAMVTRKGLGENIRQHIKHPFWRILSGLLVITAIVVGNAAYQGGNIAGASMGLNTLFYELDWPLWPVLVSVIAFVMLWRGNYDRLQSVLFFLVAIMSLSFVLALWLVKPDWSALVKGVLVPVVPTGALITVIALIGTSIVPYNLFLHAAVALQRWQDKDDLQDARKDLFISIPIGTLISMAILSTTATAFFGTMVTISGAQDIAPALTPVFGQFATWAVAAGLMAAGLSSALTAPLAAAFALTGMLGVPAEERSWSFRMAWMLVLTAGAVAASIGYRPVNLIMFAQTTNGLLLPVLAVFLLWLSNHNILGKYRNRWWQNLLGVGVVMISCILSMRMLGGVWGFL